MRWWGKTEWAVGCGLPGRHRYAGVERFGAGSDRRVAAALGNDTCGDGGGLRGVLSRGWWG
jgi:hypothetical protein